MNAELALEVPKCLKKGPAERSAPTAYVSVNADVRDCVLMTGELERASGEGV
jgi:hypothetical protein